MRNIDKVRKLFLDNKVTEASNSEIGRLTGISPHQQVYQLTQKLVEKGFLSFYKSGRAKIFYRTGNKPGINQSAKKVRTPVTKVKKTEDNLSILSFLGFEKAGCWNISNDSIDFHLTKYQREKEVLYAFISDQNVLYIGKTGRTLRQRLYGYKNPGHSQQTNIKNHDRIKKSITNGSRIDIYVLKQKEDIEYKGIKLNLAAGLEDNLIRRLRPLWNQTGK